MATLFTTATIIISGYLQAQGQCPLLPLDFLPIGGLTVPLGIGSMVLIGQRLLPARDSLLRTALAKPNLLDTYRNFGRVGLGTTLVCLVALIAGMLLFWNRGSGSF
jgi:hypothetical protein